MKKINFDDLMSGNWICSYKKDFSLSFERYNPGKMDESKEYMGVPITREILENNGFEEDSAKKNVFLLKIGSRSGIKIDLDFCEMDSFWNGLVLLETRVEYVHELQQAIKVCDLGKNISL